jgi:hypothetical protein
MPTKKPWWMSDHYTVEDPVPPILTAGHFLGPNGLALVKAWPSGVTDPGWGLQPPKGSDEGFMPRYERGEFNARRVLHGYSAGRWAFAFIMRAVRLVCIDIDGKNGGFEHAKKLGLLPPTLAETSKSGNGYHLFYVYDEPWDSVKGFGSLPDRIGIEQGVDVRSVGCVYHHDTQRWNERAAADLPKQIVEQLQKRSEKIQARHDHIAATVAAGDEMEVLLMHAQLESDLARDIPPGSRNVTLFAIGSQMAAAGTPDWQDKIRDRGAQLGLEDAEVERIITNAGRAA